MPVSYDGGRTGPPKYPRQHILFFFFNADTDNYNNTWVKKSQAHQTDGASVLESDSFLVGTQLQKTAVQIL